MTSLDPSSPVDEVWPATFGTSPLKTRAQKPRSNSLETEGVRFLQVKLTTLMNRRKERRRGSQPNSLEGTSPSPSKSNVFSRKLAGFLNDVSASSKRSSSSDNSSPEGIEASLNGGRPMSKAIPVPSKNTRRPEPPSSPSPPLTVLSSSYQRRFLPLHENNITYISPSHEEVDRMLSLPPGTKKRYASGGGVSAYSYGGPPPCHSEPFSQSLKLPPGVYGQYQKVDYFDHRILAGQDLTSRTLLVTQNEDENNDSCSEEDDFFDDCNDDKHDKGQLHRRHSMDPDRRRHGSGGFGAPYIRGDDPNQAAILFRDCRGLPAAAPFLENYKRSELEEDESQILVKFFKYHHTYDLIPTSAKLVIFDTRLQVKKAFYALVYNGVRAAPLWDATRQEFVGMLTITDFIRILQSFYNSANRKMEELEDHRLELWRSLLKDDGRKLISIGPNECLYDAIRSLIHQKIHRLPVIDPITGNVLYIITHKRILKFLYLYINELPKPMVLQKSLRELDIGTYDRIETARGETLIIEALNKFVERRISALPIVDDEGKLIDIYAKFDVINLAAEGTYHNLDVTLHQANEYRNEWFEGVLKCDLDESLGVVMERIVRAEVHRLVVVDKSNKVIGIVSLSDILNELVLKPCNDDPLSIRNRTIGQMETSLNGGNPSPEINVESLSSDNEVQNSGGTAGDEDWGGGSDLSISEDKLQERKSSAESEENFDLEMNNMPDSMTSQGVISISS